jgi:hypothetical protein
MNGLETVLLLCAVLFATLWVRELTRRKNWLECKCNHERGRGRYEWECPFHGHVDNFRYELYKQGRIGP